MEAKNYRIGNLVEQPGRIGKISEIWQDAVRIEGYNNGYDYNHTKPILLTEKWLIDFGFKRDRHGKMWIDLKSHYLLLRYAYGFYYPLYSELPEMSHEDEQQVSMNRIEFIHELQNLFFAITGQELELKHERSTLIELK